MQNLLEMQTMHWLVIIVGLLIVIIVKLLTVIRVRLLLVLRVGSLMVEEDYSAGLCLIY